jgi:uncharacterized protein YecE (DUF72 family)
LDFGRIKDIEQANYSLPLDHASVKKVLGGKTCAVPQIYVGGVLWSDKSFVGTIYPNNAKAKDYAKHYCRQFNSIELNATHYKIPEPSTFKKWALLADSSFKFCPKIHQSISHSDDLCGMITVHNTYGDYFKLLGETLGTSFLQLPPHFSPKRLHELMAFIDESNLRNLAIELRHPDWFKQSEELNTVSNYLYKNNMTLLLTDTPGRRDVLHMRLTSKTAFIRFNANDNHPSDKTRIDNWINKVHDWFQNGLEIIYFFIHTPNQINMPHLVAYFTKTLQNKTGIKVKPPTIQSEKLPENSLFS